MVSELTRLEEVENALAANEAAVTDIYKQEMVLREKRLELREERASLVDERRELRRTTSQAVQEAENTLIEGQPAEGDAGGNG